MRTIQEMRKEMGMSQSQFAKYIGMSVRTLQSWEQGVRKPHDWEISLIEEVLVYRGMILKK